MMMKNIDREFENELRAENPTYLKSEDEESEVESGATPFIEKHYQQKTANKFGIVEPYSQNEGGASDDENDPKLAYRDVKILPNYTEKEEEKLEQEQ